MVTATSADGAAVSVSVAELLPGLVSTTPAGVATVAVFTRLPVAPEAILAVTVKVTVPLTGRSTDALILPEPEAGHTPPPAPAHVQVAEDTPAGKVSVTVAPTTGSGPLLAATIV